MSETNRWPARVALLISIVMFGAVISAFDAFGASGMGPMAMQSASPSRSPSASASPSPSPSRCTVPLPPTCPSNPPPSSSPSGSPRPSGSPTGGGGGDTERHEAKITISHSAGTNDTPANFSGRVRTVNKCRPKREVLLKRVQEGPNPTVGRDTTNRDGLWSISEPPAKGRYYAKVLKRVFTQGDTRVICRGARSERVRA